MEIRITNTTLLRHTTSPVTDIPSEQKVVPLTIFDKVALNFHVATVYVFPTPAPDNAKILHALSKVLPHYPHLAGRLTTNNCSLQPCIHLNNAGVRVVETMIEANLKDHLPLEPSFELTVLHPCTYAEELLQIQLNRFACGGLVIGLTVHHQVADGNSMSLFLINWGRVARGLEVHPQPFHDRSIFVPRSPGWPQFPHNDIEFRPCKNLPKASSMIQNVIVHYSAEFVRKLKESTSSCVNLGRPFSTFECVTAHLWRKVTLARTIAQDEVTGVRVSMDGRTRLRPAVPLEFFGNLVLWTFPRLRVSELQTGGISLVVKTIREAIDHIGDAYFRSFIDFGETLIKLKEGPKLCVPDVGSITSPNIEVDSWLRFHLSEIDFGEGPPCAALPSWLPVEGLIILMQSLEKKGGVDAIVALSEDNVPLFRKICYELD